jgi:hypothetical protein
VGFTYTRAAGGFVYDQLNGLKDSADFGTGFVYNFQRLPTTDRSTL